MSLFSPSTIVSVVMPLLVSGATFPELILVGSALDADLVVLEGHVRLTALFLMPAHVPRVRGAGDQRLRLRHNDTSEAAKAIVFANGAR